MNSDSGDLMTPTTAAEPKTIPALPAREIEACIRDFLAEEGEMQAVLHGAGDTENASGNSIGPQPVIDSLVVIEILLELETIIPFELPDDLVRAGGYDNVNEVVQHLTPQLKRRWRKYYEERR